MVTTVLVLYSITFTVATLILYSDNKNNNNVINPLKNELTETEKKLNLSEENYRILKNINFDLEEKINNLQDDLNLEIITDSNSLNWSFLLAKSIFNWYSTSNSFNNLINFSENDFNTEVLRLGFQIDQLQINASDIVKDLFNEKSNIINVSPFHYNMAEYEVRSCFSKLKFIYSDLIINELMFKHNENYFYNLSKPNILKLFDEHKYIKPYSFDVNYIKNLKNDFFFKNSGISEFLI